MRHQPETTSRMQGGHQNRNGQGVRARSMASSQRTNGRSRATFRMAEFGNTFRPSADSGVFTPIAASSEAEPSDASSLLVPVAAVGAVLAVGIYFFGVFI